MMERFRAAVQHCDRIWIAARGPSSTALRELPTSKDAVFVVDKTYAIKDSFVGNPAVVLIGDESQAMEGAGERYFATPKKDRPLLCFTYINETASAKAKNIFGDTPVALLPILEGKDLYHHRGTPYPTSGVMLSMLAASLEMETFICGIDLYSHPSGQTYAEGVVPDAAEVAWPSRHSLEMDMSCLKKVHERLGDRLTGHGVAAERLGIEDPHLE